MCSEMRGIFHYIYPLHWNRNENETTNWHLMDLDTLKHPSFETTAEAAAVAEAAVTFVVNIYIFLDCRQMRLFVTITEEEEEEERDEEIETEENNTIVVCIPYSWP